VRVMELSALSKDTNGAPPFICTTADPTIPSQTSISEQAKLMTPRGILQGFRLSNLSKR
jgi:hypothetical protein